MAVEVFAILLIIVPASYQLPTVCVAPSTVHVSQSDTCKTLGNVVSDKFVVSAMIGEEENRQLVVDTRGWQPSSNLTTKLTITIDTFTAVDGGD